jgi:multidrug efflux pump subunit AcrA (membrane-fusion protein)
MLGTVRFELGDATRVLRIPSRCVVREFDLEYVFVLEPATSEEGVAEVAVAHRRRVTTRPVAFHPELLEVTRGLAAGERIVSGGLRELRDGLRVRVREPVPDAAPPDAADPDERASAR